MTKFTAIVIEDDRFTENKIQCVSTDKTYNYSKVWLNPETGKEYIIMKMYNKSCFCEIKRA